MQANRVLTLERVPGAMQNTFNLGEVAAVLDLVPVDHLPTAADLDERGRQPVTALARRRARAGRP